MKTKKEKKLSELEILLNNINSLLPGINNIFTVKTKFQGTDLCLNREQDRLLNLTTKKEIIAALKVLEKVLPIVNKHYENEMEENKHNIISDFVENINDSIN